MFISSAYRCAMRSIGPLTLGIVRRVARPLVCIPTYNEASNILALIEQVHLAAPQADVLVIDDSSPDGTGDLVRDRMLKDARLEAMARPGKLGLGTAYMAGFAFALQHGYATALTMDADFSHPPESVPILLAAVDQGADLAIGSRYVTGGAIEGWAISRRILSATANLVARQALRLRTRDCTGGSRDRDPGCEPGLGPDCRGGLPRLHRGARLAVARDPARVGAQGAPGGRDVGDRHRLRLERRLAVQAGRAVTNRRHRPSRRHRGG